MEKLLEARAGSGAGLGRPPAGGGHLLAELRQQRSSRSMPRFWIRPTTSPFRRRRSSSVTSLAVTTTMGMARHASRLRISITNSKPSITGIIRSSRIERGALLRHLLEGDPAVLGLAHLPALVLQGPAQHAAVLGPCRPPPARGARRPRARSDPSSLHQLPALDGLGQELGGAERIAQLAVVGHRHHEDRDVPGLGVAFSSRSTSQPSMPGISTSRVMAAG